MSPNTPYRFIEIWVPRRAPYSDPQHGWSSIVGDVVKPLMDHIPPFWMNQHPFVWALQEGPFVQVCYGTDGDGLLDLDSVLRTALALHRFRVKRRLRGSLTLGTALIGDRWNAPARLKRGGEAGQQRRSMYLCTIMDQVCRLYADTLIRVPGTKKALAYWRTETNMSRQNPKGSVFESVMHLIANTAEPRFDVFLSGRTGWMNPGNGLHDGALAVTVLTDLHL